MAATNEQTWKSVFLFAHVGDAEMLMLFRHAQVAEKELHASLAEKDPTLRNIDLLIAQYLLSVSLNQLHLTFQVPF